MKAHPTFPIYLADNELGKVPVICDSVYLHSMQLIYGSAWDYNDVTKKS